MTQSSSIIEFPVKEEEKKTRLSADEIETNREKMQLPSPDGGVPRARPSVSDTTAVFFNM